MIKGDERPEKLAGTRALIVALFLTSCAGEAPQHIEWVRADGKPISSQFYRDATACEGEIPKNASRSGDAGPTTTMAKTPKDVFAGCMTRRGYVEIRRNEGDGTNAHPRNN
jgi:hypothetical protein